MTRPGRFTRSPADPNTIFLCGQRYYPGCPALLQCGLYRRSPTCWLIHSLIYFPLVVRFLWGVTPLGLSQGLAGEAVTTVMLNKNHPLTAIFFDVTGLMMLGGVIAAMLHHRRGQSGHRLLHLSPWDLLLLPLIALLMGVSFVTEGLRIAMSGHPPGAEYAFVGYTITGLLGHSKAFTEISVIYGTPMLH